MTPLRMDRNFNDRFYKQNPALVLEHSIPLRITRYFTDVNGTIVDKNDVGIPDTLKTKYPVLMLGQFDRLGGYKKSLSAVPPLPGTFYYMSYTQGINSPFLSFTGLNNIKSQILTGDIVIIYTDNLEAPNWFIWFIVSSEVVSLASIVGNTESTQQDDRIGSLYIKSYNYVSDNDLQYYEPVHYTKFDNIGNYRDDQISPYMFKTPFVEQTGLLTIDTNFKLDQYIGMNMYFLFTTDQILLTLNVTKL